VIARSFAALAAATLMVACAPAPPSEPVRVADPQRVIAIAPSVVELMYELDLGDRLVGVGEHVAWPREATKKPTIGGLFNPDIEQITRLEPELAVLLPSEEQLGLHLDLLDVEVLVVPSESLTDIESAAM
jgi:iron complex transport system substrate-binding protein